MDRARSARRASTSSRSAPSSTRRRCRRWPTPTSSSGGSRRPAAERKGHAVYSGLVLNEKGLDRALACGVEMVCLGVSASETHSRKNTGMGTAEATERIVATAKKAVEAGRKVQVSVQSAFGCGFEGFVPEERVLDIARAYVDAGLLTIALADTAGHAYPEQVERLYGKLLALHPGIEAACHLHDTYGAGMANIYAALRAGAVSLESSFAGLGGCPFTKVAAGNVATEDLVHTLQRTGSGPTSTSGASSRWPATSPRSSGARCPGASTGPAPSPQLKKQETPA